MQILKIKTVRRTLGNFGERAAAKALKRVGYKILERNYAPEDSEIDIIAVKDGITAFIEVKTRRIYRDGSPGFESRPAAAVNLAKQEAIMDAAKIYLASHRGTKVRFDVIEVYVSGDAPRWRAERIHHIEGAFGKRSYRG